MRTKLCSVNFQTDKAISYFNHTDTYMEINHIYADVNVSLWHWNKIISMNNINGNAQTRKKSYCADN